MNDPLQSAADRINNAVAEARIRGTKPPVIRGRMNIKDVIKFQRAIRRCSVKWHADQVKEEVKGEDETP